MDNELMNRLEEQIANAQSDEEVIQIFADAGINVTLDQLNSAEMEANGELSEGSLEQVSGGSALYLAWKLYQWYRNRSRSNGSGRGGAFSGGGGNAGGGGGGGGRGF